MLRYLTQGVSSRQDEIAMISTSGVFAGPGSHFRCLCWSGFHAYQEVFFVGKGLCMRLSLFCIEITHKVFQIVKQCQVLLSDNLLVSFGIFRQVSLLVTEI